LNDGLHAACLYLLSACVQIIAIPSNTLKLREEREKPKSKKSEMGHCKERSSLSVTTCGTTLSLLSVRSLTKGCGVVKYLFQFQILLSIFFNFKF